MRDPIQSIEYQRADKLFRLGNMMFQTANFPSALNSFKEALRILRPLRDRDHPNSNLDHRLGVLLHNLSSSLAKLGQNGAAFEHAREAHSVASELRAKHPENREYAALAAAIANDFETIKDLVSGGEPPQDQEPRPNIALSGTDEIDVSSPPALTLEPTIDRAGDPHFTARTGAGMEEVFCILQYNLLLPLAGLPPFPFIMLRKCVRESFAYFEQVSPRHRRTELRELIIGHLRPRSKFSADIPLAPDGSDLNAPAAAAALRGFLTDFQEDLPTDEEAHFACGLILGNLHFAAEVALVVPLLRSAPIELRRNLEIQIASIRRELEILVNEKKHNPTLSYLMDALKKLLKLLSDRERPPDSVLKEVVELCVSAMSSFGYEPIADVLARELYFRSSGKMPKLKTSHLARDLILEAHSKSELYKRSPDPAFLDEAIAIALRAIAVADKNCREWAICVSDLGGNFHERFKRKGRLDDLNSAIRYLLEALKSTHWTDPFYWSMLNNLGLATWTRYSSGTMIEDLHIAVDCLEQLTTEREPALRSVGLNSSHPLYFPLDRLLMWQTNYANSLHYRARALSSSHELNVAIEQFRAILNATPTSSADFGVHRMNLANALRDRFDRWKARADLQEAIDLHRAGVIDTRLAIDEAPGHGTLALDLAELYDLDRQESVREEAVACFRSALQVSVDVGLSHRLAAQWGTWAFRRAAWGEAVEALGKAALLADERHRVQLERNQKEFWLRSTQGLVALHAYSRVMISIQTPESSDKEALIDAILILENGQAQLLNEVLDLNRANLHGLVTIGREDLYLRYSAIADRIDKLKLKIAGPSDGPMPSAGEVYEYDTLRQQLETAIDEIRSIEGYGEFMRTVSFDSIRAAASERTLVYLLSTPKGGLAIVLSDNGNTITPVWLGGISDHWVLKNTVSLLRYNERALMGAVSAGDILQHLDLLVEDISAQLEPLLKNINFDDQPVTLIASSLLSMLPLHLAVFDGVSLLERSLVTIAPTARTLLPRSNPIISPSASGGCLAIAPPSDLLCNQEEARIAAQYFGSRPLLGEEATRARTFSEARDLAVLHFSCHAHANVFSPLRSSIDLADGALTVAEILENPLVNVDLAVLSACRSGVPGMELPDETVSLPAALLQVGVRSVISTLWVVGDYSSAMVIIRFYFLWKAGGHPAAEALRQAQLWVRDTTNKEKLDFFTEQRAQELLKYLLGRNLEVREHSAYWYWGGFVWSGETRTVRKG